MNKKVDIQSHILMLKHEKLNEDSAKKLLEKYNISKKQLPSILKSDPAISNLEAKPGDIIEITRRSPTIGYSKFYRVVVNG